jgi:hypothetical protein
MWKKYLKMLFIEGIAKPALEAKSEDFCAGSVFAQIDRLRLRVGDLRGI